MGLLYNGWLYDAFPNEYKDAMPPNHWKVKENVLKEAAKYKTKMEFRNGSGGAFNAAMRYGWMGEICENFVKPQVKYMDITKKIHCVYVYEMQEQKACYVGRTINLHNRDLSHRRGRKHHDGSITYDVLYEFCRDNSIEIPKPIVKEPDLDGKDSLIMEDFWVKEYSKNGWNVLNKAKTGELSGSLGAVKKWTYEACKEFCKDYKYRGEVENANYSCYFTCLRNWWFDEFGIKEKYNTWESKDKLIEVARACKNISDFAHNFYGGYLTAKKNGWLDDVANSFIKDNTDEEKKMCDDYLSGMTLLDVRKKYGIGRVNLLKVFEKHGISARKKGGDTTNKKADACNAEKCDDGYHYIAIDKETKFETTDYLNKAGVLTSYIKTTHGVEVPTLYYRKKYKKDNGHEWWEQWFDIVKVRNKEVKRCPYCDWSTVDVENNSGAFEVHLSRAHGMTKIEYLDKNQQDKKYFSLKNLTLNRQMENDPTKFVECAICGKKLARIDGSHLSKHGITLDEYKVKYSFDTVSDELHNKLSESTSETNLNMSPKFESDGEREIREFIVSHGIECHKDRKLLGGDELDIYIPSKGIAIEYNGLYWHQDKFGKDKSYHLNKLNNCNEKGVRLISIFEDEFVLHKELVLDKISHTLGLNCNKERIMARKTQIARITCDDARNFLTKYCIQGFADSTMYYGAYYGGELIATMTFTENGHGWILSRFATNINYRCQGVASKILRHFINDNDVKTILSFGDRRWVSNDDNLYTKLGFELDEILEPDYKYYNPSVSKYTRFDFRRSVLNEKYGLSMEMREMEMAERLGYGRIWDCGLLRYKLG